MSIINYVARRESTIFKRAARTAGKKPPIIPMPNAKRMAPAAIPHEISKLKTISAKVSQLVVEYVVIHQLTMTAQDSAILLKTWKATLMLMMESHG